MLELPESQTLAKQMEKTIKGKRIIRVEANQSVHRFAFFFGPPEEYPQQLEGRVIDGGSAFGGLVELSLGEVRLAFGDGANVRYLKPGAVLPKKHQLALEFDDGSHLVCTIQMYGGIWVFEDGENDNFYYLVAKEKPSPLSKEFDEIYFQELMKREPPKLSAKSLLATEQRIPGLGNGVLHDILFHAGIHPKTPIGVLTEQQRELLFHCVKDTLSEMTRLGGRDTEKDLFGQPGRYRTCLSKNTLKDPCPQCGGAIIRQAYLGGNVYFCPHCQPLEKL